MFNIHVQREVGRIVSLNICILTFKLLICKFVILKSTRVFILSEIYPNRTQVDEILKKRTNHQTLPTVLWFVDCF